MIEETIEVGPFTPQETEELVEKLKARGVRFDLLKDEETEKAEMKSDYANLVNKVEWRTESYIGQIFYLKVSQRDFNQMKSLFSEYGMATAPKENPDELKTDFSDIREVHQDAVAQKKLQRVLIWAFFAMVLSYAIYMLRSAS